MEIRMFLGKSLKLVKIENVLRASAPKEKPACSVRPAVINSVYDIVHRRHAASAADTYNLYGRILVQEKFSVRAGKSYGIAFFEAVQICRTDTSGNYPYIKFDDILFV